MRHCTLRPRDAVSIGKEISKIKPERRDRASIRSAINSAAAERVQALFTEVLPFFDGLFPELFPKIIPTNVLSESEIKKISNEYFDTVSREYGITSDSVKHPICALYALGLLGVVAEDRGRNGSLIQKFAPVGQVPFGSIRVLPKADIYLIHPSLTDYIQSKNVGFIRKTNRQNVIGDNLEWRSEQEIRFVAVGDMRGYRDGIMNKIGPSQTFPKYWSEMFGIFTRDLDYASSSSGDSVLLADRSPTRLVRALINLMTALRNSNYAMSFRFGLHSGFWRLNHDQEGGARPEISDIVGIAARMEPFVLPGDILISGDTISHASRLGVDLVKDGVERVGIGYFPDEVFSVENGLKISKTGKEVDEWVTIYVLRTR